MAKFPALMKKYKGKLMIVSISADEKLAAVKSFTDKQHYSGLWEIWHNGKQGNYPELLR